MGYDHSRIKSNAQLFYKNNQGSSILSILIMLGISMGTSYAVSVAAGILGSILSIPAAISMKSTDDILTVWYIVITFFQYVMSIAVSLALFPLMIGLNGWYTRSIYKKTPLGEMFAPYKKQYIWSNIGTGFLMQLYIFLWMLLFIIPGIIKAYSYSQTFFIKAENPNIPAQRAIELSRIMMDGHKFDLFYLHISFIGWGLLSLLTFNILGIVYVYPYYYAAQAFAYEEIKIDAASRGLFDIREIQPDYVG